MQSKVLQQPITKTEVRFRKWKLTESGIADSKLLVPWNDVKAISYSGLVIGGYGATTITYNNEQGKEKSLIIKPKISPDYHDFIRYLIQHASHASIDPGLIKALEYSPDDARADMTATMLLIFAVVLLVILPFFIGAYSPMEGEPTIFQFMPFLLAILPMGMTIKLLVGRFRGKAEPASKKLLWSALSNGVQALGVIVFLILSPFSAYYVVGDIGMKTNNLMAAEHWYNKALEEVPGNIDVTFDMGLMYREKKEYETAFGYFVKAYTKNPKYFGPLGLELIPDTLLKMGRYDDSLTWCDKILDANRRKREIQEVLERKRNEIVAEMAKHNSLKQDAIKVSN
jgi:tetratricopeptide (TPR) repeat protein